MMKIQQLQHNIAKHSRAELNIAEQSRAERSNISFGINNNISYNI